MPQFVTNQPIETTEPEIEVTVNPRRRFLWADSGFNS
jgi:hypothetical protein